MMWLNLEMLLPIKARVVASIGRRGSADVENGSDGSESSSSTTPTIDLIRLISMGSTAFITDVGLGGVSLKFNVSGRRNIRAASAVGCRSILRLLLRQKRLSASATGFHSLKNMV